MQAFFTTLYPFHIHIFYNFAFMTYNELCHRLAPLYGAGEARAIVRMVAEDEFGLTPTDIYMDKVSQLSADERAKFEEIISRIANYEPVQYVLGHADFCGRRFSVAPGVLIPRPETEMLIPMVGSGRSDHFTLLDIGTGSGCIAISAALEFVDAQVTAWDISDNAIDIARSNATRLGASVNIVRQDALNPPADTALWDVIVSNPPYICMNEQADMSRNVLDYEPATALFVPDYDPLLFYRAIAQYAVHALKPGGRLLFEINPLYVNDMGAMLSAMRYTHTVTDDQYGRKRFITAQLRTNE